MYVVDEQDRVIEFKDAPPSSVGAPNPILLSDERLTLLAYGIQERPFPFDEGRVLAEAEMGLFVGELALVEVRSCQLYMFGAPNDEAFAGHPLAGRGLRPYGSFEIENSSWVRQLERMNSVHPSHNPERFLRLRHFVFAFHDSTFECVAETLTISKHRGTLKDLLPEMERLLQCRMQPNKLTG